jgi:hypothetical protein
MLGRLYRISSVKGLKNLGDPAKIIEYMHTLEERVIDAGLEIDSLKAEIERLSREVSSKIAEIQHLEAVNRGKW